MDYNALGIRSFYMKRGSGNPSDISCHDIIQKTECGSGGYLVAHHPLCNASRTRVPRLYKPNTRR